MRKPLAALAAATLTLGIYTAPAGASEPEPVLDCHQFNGLLVSREASPGQGYWYAFTDGGVFSYDGAHFYGSAGALPLNQPVIEMAANPNGGYWLLALDGGVFSYDTGFYGSLSGQITDKAQKITSAPDGLGYWITTESGVYAFGSAEQYVQPTDPSRTTGNQCSSVPMELVRESRYGAPVYIEILVERYFEPRDVAQVIRIIRRESNFQPWAVSPSGTYVGLMQHSRYYFPARAAAAGFPGASPFDPEANIAAGAWLWYSSGPHHWN